MRITVSAIGRMRAGALDTLIWDYARRLTWPLALREHETRPGRGGPREEAALLLGAVPAGAVIVALDERGRDLPSAELATRLGAWRDQGRAEIAFLIGGADGLDETVRARADLLLAFGRATWPHLLVRAMLVEQIYRAQTILAGHPYHRA